MDRSARIEFFLEHYQHPRNSGELADADAAFQMTLPGCQDWVKFFICMADGRIARVAFTGDGCAISQAAASVLTDAVVGLSAAEVEALDYHFVAGLLGDDLIHSRPRCATLGLEAVKAALRQL